jgi:DMSO/TMAO reductase YedYZ molybdopterin-dependent catalytic subunit
MKIISENYADFVVHLWDNPEEFTRIYIGTQPVPFAERFTQDHCEIIKDNIRKKYYLMVPGSGSFYFELTDEDIKKYENFISHYL